MTDHNDTPELTEEQLAQLDRLRTATPEQLCAIMREAGEEITLAEAAELHEAWTAPGPLSDDTLDGVTGGRSAPNATKKEVIYLNFVSRNPERANWFFDHGSMEGYKGDTTVKDAFYGIIY